VAQAAGIAGALLTSGALLACAGALVARSGADLPSPRILEG
jgi:hypothetical protein